jgi:hypothetical protein
VVAGVTELVQQELEPQLVDLVDGDEQQLVVRRRVRDRDLLVEHLGNAQVAAVRQPPALLAEPPVPIRHAADHIRPAPNQVRSRDLRRRSHPRDPGTP